MPSCALASDNVSFGVGSHIPEQDVSHIRQNSKPTMADVDDEIEIGIRNSSFLAGSVPLFSTSQI